jgi:hypothetical protein
VAVAEGHKREKLQVSKTLKRKTEKRGREKAREPLPLEDSCRRGFRQTALLVEDPCLLRAVLRRAISLTTELSDRSAPNRWALRHPEVSIAPSSIRRVPHIGEEKAPSPSSAR